MAKLGKIFGTDVSKSSFSVAYRKGTSVETRTWDYTQEQMAAFAETLDEGCTVVMEATGVYYTRLAYYLYGKGISVSVVNPLASKNFARTLMRRTNDGQGGLKAADGIRGNDGS